MYNTTISQGIFPTTFKGAKVTSLHKKDSTNERGNYRPISVLPILAKPLERYVATAFLRHLTMNKLFYKNQSAYRPYHSCETAPLNISDKWLKAMDNSELVITVFLDLSKAFDLVNHDIIIAGRIYLNVNKSVQSPVCFPVLHTFTEESHRDQF